MASFFLFVLLLVVLVVGIWVAFPEMLPVELRYSWWYRLGFMV